MKYTQSGELFAHMNQSNLNEIKAGIAQIMQGCMTLNRALTMSQVPKPVVLHDAHVQAYNRHNAAEAKISKAEMR
jgi:uncharacterized protein YwlG (UPF0340 family)